ncbi:hypothetical protein JP75_02605 [Devosia riboflavina]|uniref:Transmembrane protein n=1 Tax=Devosia riboflavina TaxID=46914 RepID=A0A087M6F8_9HYPH|nr:hypothetical protein [Devosia riboflavina]KFL32461.1 hypothetical protein JP75_02605 [Devosia riboflavina]
MFGISPIGWVHTLGSLPALAMAAYMLVRHGRIVPRSIPGAIYFASMVLGGATAFLVAKQPVSYAIGGLTLILIAVGYGIHHVTFLGRLRRYIETISLSFSVLLLLLPTTTETLTRVPDGAPLASSVSSPIVLGSHGALLLAFVVGLIVQIVVLRREGRATAAA